MGRKTDENIDKKLIEAVIKDDYKTVAKLLSQGANPNGFIDDDKLSPLFFAAYHNSLKSAKLLLSAGADPNYNCAINDETPIEVAKRLGYSQMTAILANNDEMLPI